MVSNSRGENKGMAPLFVFGFFFSEGGWKKTEREKKINAASNETSWRLRLLFILKLDEFTSVTLVFNAAFNGPGVGQFSAGPRAAGSAPRTEIWAEAKDWLWLLYGGSSQQIGWLTHRFIVD